MQNFVSCGQIRVLFSDAVNFRDYTASVIIERRDMQHWSDTDRGEMKYLLGSNTCPIPTLSTTDLPWRSLLLEV
jgi:hypothetical protein